MPQEQKTRLLLGFRIGATHSRISYSILEPGKGPEIRGIHQFPGQPIPGKATIPSVIYYSRDGEVRAAGNDVGRDCTEALIRNENWVKAERFVLHFQPKDKVPRQNLTPLPPLPLRKTAVEVLSDFLVYLNNSAKWYIREFLPVGSGSITWDKVPIHYVLSHPNEWAEPQQSLMRQAVEAAGLITDNGQNQLSFVPEGEACLDFSIRLEPTDPIWRTGVIIITTNNETVDINSYTSGTSQATFIETTEPQCYARGSGFVTQAAQEHLYGLLKDSRFHSDIPDMVQYFNRVIKPAFCNPGEAYYIPLSSTRDTHVRLHIREGKLRLDGADIATFYQPLIKCIIDGALTQRRITRRPLYNVLLLGNLASNDYVLGRVQDGLKPHGAGVKRPSASAQM
ncbi:hypothetical protein P691DRAFT_679352 [Macrolepiota fuliginosa MF-IS2]|uniref:Uncharacterized protein n=1 Tax=Macrolepiota fuliginosa MF-IS2 TaxID=1400762 RepID=A0A9P5X2Y5_9AGAR|nr:hypothetical protein P691DRAFT_679352 [Macrolepiota fuliginosa MF-IS2]